MIFTVLTMLILQIAPIENVVTWYAAAGPVDHYEVQVSLDNQQLWQAHSSVSVNSVVLSYPAFTPVAVRVRAMTANGYEGSWSEVGLILITPKFPAPTHQ